MTMIPHSIRSGTSGRSAAGPRRGAVLILAMIGLLLVSMIGVTVLQMTLLQRRHLRDEELRLQTQWLVEAGLERAVVMLRQDDGFTGDVWTVPSGVLRQQSATTVTIQVPEAGEDNLRQITVEATVTIDGQQQAQITRTFPYRTADDDDT